MTTPNDEENVAQQLEDANQGPEQDTVNEQPQEQEQESKAPWADYLQKFPSSLHPVAEEVFKEWDGNVTKRFQDLHSTYDPYKEIITQWEPEPIQQALEIAAALENDPASFYKALAEAYGFAESEQGVANQQQSSNTDSSTPTELDENDPYAARFKQLEELSGTLAQHVLDQERAKIEAEQAAEQEVWLNETLETLKKEKGEFDEDYVIQQIANGIDPEQAVTQFQSLVSSWAAKQNAPARSAPQVMRGGGSVPSLQVDPATLNGKQTKDLVAEYLRTATGG